MSNSPCPTEADLRNLVAGNATPVEQTALAEHLDGCADCRSVLDRLAGSPDSWGHVAEAHAAADPALAKVMDDLQKTSAEPRSAGDGDLDFLDPPEKPGQLGKLADYE